MDCGRYRSPRSTRRLPPTSLVSLTPARTWTWVYASMTGRPGVVAWAGDVKPNVGSTFDIGKEQWVRVHKQELAAGVRYRLELVRSGETERAA